jgi:hypothetical protein
MPLKDESAAGDCTVRDAQRLARMRPSMLTAP